MNKIINPNWDEYSYGLWLYTIDQSPIVQIVISSKFYNTIYFARQFCDIKIADDVDIPIECDIKSLVISKLVAAGFIYPNDRQLLLL